VRTGVLRQESAKRSSESFRILYEIVFSCNQFPVVHSKDEVAMMDQKVYPFSAGNRSMSDLLGGKGANLAEMATLGIPVPDGVSVRSGAKFSMPGMMETVLNVGMNQEVAAQLENLTSDATFAWDSYRRFIQMYGKTVYEVNENKFAAVTSNILKTEGVSTIAELRRCLRALGDAYVLMIEKEIKSPFAFNARAQLIGAIEAVFHSWNSERAQIYRRRERIASDLGTAVNVQMMVFGNIGEDSGTGVCFTRDPATGAYRCLR
jgi:pyruvate, orthophosphate dikinase